MTEPSRGYRTVSVESLPDAPSPAAHKKEVDEAVGTREIGFNVFTVAPGERMPWGYHYHPDHEELFYVTEGEMTFETEDGTYLVGLEEAFYVPPGLPQRCYNDGSTDARVVAVGAPKENDGGVIAATCPACDAVSGRYKEVVETDGRREYVLYCSDCDARVDRFGAGPDPVRGGD